MLNPFRSSGQSKGKVLGEPLLALGVGRVDGRVLRLRRASGVAHKVRQEVRVKSQTGAECNGAVQSLIRFRF